MYSNFSLKSAICSLSLLSLSALSSAQEGAEAQVPPLHQAVLDQKSAEELDLLLRQGASVLDVNEYQETALHWASRRGYLDQVRWLLKNKAPVIARDENGESPIFWAARYGHSAIIKLLAGDGALPSFNRNMETPLHVAVVAGRVDSVRVLLDLGVQAGSYDRSGYTPLMRAARLGYFHPKIREIYAQIYDILFASEFSRPHAKDPSGHSAVYYRSLWKEEPES